MINKNIIKIRKELDKLDDSLLAIIKKRSLLVDKVIKNKNFKKDIIDKKRISIILKNIYKKSKIKKIDTTITKKIWVSMIRAFIDYEFRNFKKKNSYLLCGGSFFSTKNSCLRVFGLYFFNFNLSLAFSPLVGFFA
jgi:chorismate mutase